MTTQHPPEYWLAQPMDPAAVDLALDAMVQASRNPLDNPDALPELTDDELAAARARLEASRKAQDEAAQRRAKEAAQRKEAQQRAAMLRAYTQAGGTAAEFERDYPRLKREAAERAALLQQASQQAAPLVDPATLIN